MELLSLMRGRGMGAGGTRSAFCCSCHQLRIADTLDGASASMTGACTSIMVAARGCLG